jgi:hypothetical protein
MCRHCQSPLSVPESRRSFLRKVTAAAAGVSLLGATRVAAQGDLPQVAKSGWARLITPNPNWDFHRDRDDQVGAYLGEALNLRAGFDTVSPLRLRDICAYPFLFSFDLAAIRNPDDWSNVREYLYRGGFLYLDYCVRVLGNLTLAQFADLHLARLTRLLPGAEVRRLSAKHPVFRSPFPINLDILTKAPEPQAGQVRTFYGIFDDDRMVAMVSTAQLFCGWPEEPQTVDTKLRMLTDVYAYSRAH